MAIIRVLSQHVIDGPTSHPSGFNIERNSFKIIYVAPMKALASEIVSKFAKRLAWLSIKVRELTGDMQLTKQEIEETQIIVTTPEKWDVVTRKPTGEGELASKVKLLIIDEVHLLAEDRGAVIETIVARTLRQVHKLFCAWRKDFSLLTENRLNQDNLLFVLSVSVPRCRIMSMLGIS